MKRLVVVSYHYSPQFNDPASWFDRIASTEGIIDALAEYYEVYDIHQVNYTGDLTRNKVHHIFIQRPFNKFFPLSLHKQVKQLQPDIVFIHGLHYAFQLIQLRWMIGKKARIIVQHHAEQPKGRAWQYFFRMADRMTDGYFFATRPMADMWLNRQLISDQNKVFTVSEASSIFCPGKTNGNDKNKFLWAGRLNENKDPLTVVKAFSRYARQNPLAELYMIYQAEELLEEVKNAIAQNGSSSNIHLIGKVQLKEMVNWYRSCAYIICSSYYEGCNVSVIEGMSCGCIPIVTKIPSFELHTNKGKLGLQFKAGDEEGLLQCLFETENIDTVEEQKKVISYFEEELSFTAIAATIHACLS